MKRYHLAVLAVVATLVSAFGIACSFENRSDAYLCPTGNECESGRVCSDGWCVLSNMVAIDADNMVAIDANNNADVTVPSPDAASCPPECTSCAGGVCLIDCPNSADCQETVVCPLGIPCGVSCGGSGSCAGGVDCSEASACQVSCSGAGSCAELVVCGGGICNIDCSATGSCAGGLNCETSCQCDTACAFGCGANLCPGNNACVKNELCDSTPVSCKSC